MIFAIYPGNSGWHDGDVVSYDSVTQVKPCKGIVIFQGPDCLKRSFSNNAVYEKAEEFLKHCGKDIPSDLKDFSETLFHSLMEFSAIEQKEVRITDMTDQRIKKTQIIHLVEQTEDSKTRREGSKAAKVRDLYEDGMTVEEMTKKLNKHHFKNPTAWIRGDLVDGFISLEEPEEVEEAA